MSTYLSLVGVAAAVLAVIVADTLSGGLRASLLGLIIGVTVATVRWVAEGGDAR